MAINVLGLAPGRFTINYHTNGVVLNNLSATHEFLCPCTKMPLNKNACVEVCRSRAWLFVTCSKSIQFTHFSIYSLTVRLHKPFTIKGSHRSGLIVSRVSEKTSSFTFFDRVVFVLRSKHSCAISFGIS